MDRRDFLRAGIVLGGAAALEGTGVTAAFGASAATLRHASSILDLAPSESGIDTVVVAMMENRSFDSYLGWLARNDRYLERGRSLYGSRFFVDGDIHQSFPAPDGTMVDTYRRVLAAEPDPWRGCGHPDPGHGWNAGRAQRDGGFLAPGSGNDEFALSYFKGADLPVYRKLARRFTVCDRWHASLLGPTFPNREYLLSGQSGGHKDNYLPTAEGGFAWPNIFDRLAAAGVSAADYYTDLPPSLLWGNRMLPFIRPMDRYYEDAVAGALPRVTFVNPAYTGPNRTDDHPLGDPRAAQAFVRDVFAAFARSPQWERGLFVLTYDEWGGFFDHVAPPILPDDRASLDDAENFAQAGFRVPAIICSPRALPNAVDHSSYDHTSILRFLHWRFLGAPPVGPGRHGATWYLTRRDRFAANPGVSLSASHFDPDPGFDLDVVLDPPSAPCPEDLGGGLGGIAMSSAATDGATAVVAEPTAFEVAQDAGFFEAMGFTPTH